MKASDFCTNAADLMADRAASRDSESERSMTRCVGAFNALYGYSLSVTEGWQFMSILKKARGAQGAFRQDDYEDDVAYCALAGEAACEAQQPLWQREFIHNKCIPDSIPSLPGTTRPFDNTKDGPCYPDNSRDR